MNRAIFASLALAALAAIGGCTDPLPGTDKADLAGACVPISDAGTCPDGYEVKCCASSGLLGCTSTGCKPIATDM